MRKNTTRLCGTILAVALFSPVGYAFSAGSRQTAGREGPNSIKWADRAYASQTIGRIQDLSRKIEREVGPIQSEGRELFVSDQAHRLNEIKSQVNEMNFDLFQLSEMKKESRLEPWQAHLVDRMAPKIHEIAYQTRAAIKTLNGQRYNLALQGTSYPQYIAVISDEAGQLKDSIGTVTQRGPAAEEFSKLAPRAQASGS